MKRYYILFLTVVALTVMGCQEPEDKGFKSSKMTSKDYAQPATAEPEEFMYDQEKADENHEVTSVDIQNKIHEYQKKLHQTEDLLIKRTAERDAVKTEFLQLIRGKGKTPKEIVEEFRKKSSDLNIYPWFNQAKLAWQKWEMYERSVVIFTRQHKRLEKSLEDLKLAFEKLKLNEENKTVYISGEDPNLDAIMVSSEISIDLDNLEKNISEVEKAEISIKVEQSMMGTVEKNVSKIPGLKLSSIDEMPDLPDIAKMIDDPANVAQRSLFGRVKNDCNKILSEAVNKVKTHLDNKQPEAACDVWLQTIDELDSVVNAWEEGQIISQGYRDKLETCRNETLLTMCKPYLLSLKTSVEKLENEDPDWDTIMESLEGALLIHPILSESDSRKIESLMEIIRLHLKYLLNRQDMDANVIKQRLEKILSDWKTELIKINRGKQNSSRPIRNIIPANNYAKVVSKSDYGRKREPLTIIENEPLILVGTDSASKGEFNRGSRTHNHIAGDRRIITVNDVGFAFRYCPPNTFVMGSPESEYGRNIDEKQHQVTQTKGFWMMETEVTQEQWKAIMGNNPSAFEGDNLPVEQVTWEECREFCRRCSRLGLRVQLPTEAQWEYACRAGSTGVYAGDLDEMAWYSSNSRGQTHPVRMKKPNAWGLYDMYGNVCELCQDWKADYPCESVTDSTNPLSGVYRVIRGGSWNYTARYCRSANRDGIRQGGSNNYLGFRVIVQ